MPLPADAPLTSGVKWVPRRPYNPFRMMRLNLAGWSALVGGGLVLAVPGLVVGWRPALSLMSGVAVAFIAVWSNDYRRWRGSWMIGFPMPDEKAEALAAHMRSAGLDVMYEPAVLDKLTGEMLQSARFRCRAPHAQKLRQRLGIPDLPRGHRRRLL